MGMQYQPLVDGLPPGARVTSDLRGTVDPRGVTAVRLMVPSPSTPQALVIGDLALVGGRPRDKAAYSGIVDAFGQYTRQAFPDEAAGTEDLYAGWQTESGG